MSKILSVTALVALAGSATAQNPLLTFEPADVRSLSYLDGSTVIQDHGGARIPDGTTYSVFSGLATSSGGLVLVESGTAPVRDDVVSWDGASEAINDYLNIPGSGAVGQTRSVTENTVIGGSSSVLTITINGSGELAPTGLAAGTPAVALTRAAFGVGINLGAALGNDPLLWGPGATVPVTLGRINLFDAAGASLTGGFLTLPLSTFFGNGNWNGVFGVVFSANSAGLGIRSAVIEITTTKIPTPGAAGLLGVAGLVAARRRRA